MAAYDSGKYGTLEGYGIDVVEICCALGLERVVFVGHSVSAMIGVLAAASAPELFAKLVLVGPSPRYTNDGDYVGGFDEADIDELLASLDDNYLGWSSAMGPVIMGNPERPELGASSPGSAAPTRRSQGSSRPSPSARTIATTCTACACRR